MENADASVGAGPIGRRDGLSCGPAEDARDVTRYTWKASEWSILRTGCGEILTSDARKARQMLRPRFIPSPKGHHSGFSTRFSRSRALNAPERTEVGAIGVLRSRARSVAMAVRPRDRMPRRTAKAGLTVLRAFSPKMFELVVRNLCKFRVGRAAPGGAGTPRR